MKNSKIIINALSDEFPPLAYGKLYKTLDIETNKHISIFVLSKMNDEMIHLDNTLRFELNNAINSIINEK